MPVLSRWGIVMATLSIADLAQVQDLDSEALTAVRGGFAMSLPAQGMPPVHLEQPKLLVDAAQSLGQGQTTLVNNGSNVAFVGTLPSHRGETNLMRNEVNF